MRTAKRPDMTREKTLKALSSGARVMYEAMKALCEPGEKDVYPDLAESLAEVYGSRAQAAREELMRAGLIELHETYITIL